MTLHPQYDQIAAFLLSLECLDAAGQRDAFLSETTTAGVTYVPSARNGTSNPVLEIALHGVAAYGASEDEAMRNWKKAARAQITLVDGDGFITVHPPFPIPRSHAEEIANIRATAGAAAF